MSVDYTVISIGAMGANRLWGESAPVRTSHATSTLVIDGDRRILVDPSLPPAALAARFNERTGRGIDSVTDVFCTTLRPVHRRSIEAFADARWWACEAEIEAYARHLESMSESADRLEDDQVAAIEADRALVRRFQAAPDQFGPQTSLFPLHGASPGSAGLLLTPATTTVLIAGDAIITGGHFLAGQIWQGCHDTEAAQESFRDAMEIADVIIPGHDNVMLVQQRMI